MPFERLLLDLIVIFIAGKAGGEIAERLKQPAVLGELVAGILVGGSVLGASQGIPFIGTTLVRFSVHGDNQTLKLLAEIGAVMLLFEAGLESDINELKRLGFAALWVASIGVLLPGLLGYGAGLMLGMSVQNSLFLGAALTATSVGITARTFGDLNLGHLSEAKVVLGAAVADDVLGLIVLAVVTGVGGTGGSASAHSPIQILLLAVLFLAGSLVIGFKGAPMILRYAARMKTRAALATMALSFCFGMAALAHIVGGLAPIVGAFAAGLILSTTEHRLHFEERIKPIADVFIPIFFVMMGGAMPIYAINPLTHEGQSTLLLAGILTIVAIIGKVLAGLSMPMGGLRRLVVGVGMIPRGEVGLICASLGLQTGMISERIFTALILMVMATTFVTPPLLKIVLSKNPLPKTDGAENQIVQRAA